MFHRIFGQNSGGVTIDLSQQSSVDEVKLDIPITMKPSDSDMFQALRYAFLANFPDGVYRVDVTHANRNIVVKKM